MGKPDYTAIKECHQLLTMNAALDESDLGGGKKGYIGLVLTSDVTGT